MSDIPAILLQDVTFSYGAIPVLQDVSFAVQERDLNYIVGPNGGGKTTLLRIILGLLYPEAGEVLVFGEAPEHGRHYIGYTPQHIHFDPHFPMTVMDVVLMGKLGQRWGGRFSKSEKNEALTGLDEIGLANLKDKLFSELSGGQRQRVLIARALASDPKLLLLDEPTANVDTWAEDKLFEIIAELNKRMAILMVSHNIGFASDMVKSVICVNRKVVVHPTSDISGDTIKNIYGEDVRIIRHDLKL